MPFDNWQQWEPDNFLSVCQWSWNVCQWNKSESIRSPQFVSDSVTPLTVVTTKAVPTTVKSPTTNLQTQSPHQQPTASLLSLRSLPSKCSLPTPRTTHVHQHQWQLTFQRNLQQVYVNPTCNSPSAHVPMSVDLESWSLEFGPDFDQAKQYYYQMIEDLINAEVWFAGVNQVRLRRRRKEPSHISLCPFANDVSLHFSISLVTQTYSGTTTQN
jgi:hypothetical protein